MCKQNYIESLVKSLKRLTCSENGFISLVGVCVCVCVCVCVWSYGVPAGGPRLWKWGFPVLSWQIQLEQVDVEESGSQRQSWAVFRREHEIVSAQTHSQQQEHGQSIQVKGGARVERGGGGAWCMNVAAGICLQHIVVCPSRRLPFCLLHVRLLISILRYLEFCICGVWGTSSTRPLTPSSPDILFPRAVTWTFSRHFSRLLAGKVPEM